VLVEFADQAKVDVDEAFDWYASKSIDALDGFLRALDHAVGVVSSGPEIWPQFEAGTQRYVFRRYPFSLIYRAFEDRIVIVAVAPHRKRPGYWK